MDPKSGDFRLRINYVTLECTVVVVVAFSRCSIIIGLTISATINGSPFVRSTTKLSTKGIDAEKCGEREQERGRRPMQ